MFSTTRIPPRPRIRLRAADRRDSWFLYLWSFIACVSVHDGYLVAMYPHAIVETERNPLGQLLLAWGRGEIWYLLGVKIAGTIVVCGLLLLLFWHNRRIAWAVATGLATFQLWLLMHLTFS